MKNNITGKDLKEIGYSEGKILGLALDILKDNFAYVEEKELLVLFKKVKNYPESFLDDEVLNVLATAIIEDANPKSDGTIELVENAKDYTIFGADYIEEGARNQMDIAMKSPVSVAGALMPDAHQGYGLPIGGVLATRNAIIPYGVGVDIGCRMALSIFDIPEKHYFGKDAMYKRELIAFTKFGAGREFRSLERADHEVLESEDFNSTPFLKNLHGKAWAQLGTSGGGNHFVEWGIIDFAERDEILNIDKGRYVALLTHSGSRGFGATIAGHYTKLAKDICKLPKEALNLAYLDWKSAEG